MKKLVGLIMFLMVAAPIAWVLVYQFEGEKPFVDILLPSLYLNKSHEMSLKVTDRKTGLRRVMAAIVQQGNEKVLLEKKYESPGFSGILSESKTMDDSFIVKIEPWKYSMKDGEAIIRVIVSDYSWQGWNKGNITFIEKKIIIDSKPPRVNVLTKRHNIEKGGSGLVIYELFEDNIKSGVRVGDNFFPGHSGLFENKNIYTAFFALNHNQGPGTRLAVVAEDLAGNITKRGFYHYIRDKNFKTDILNISDGFLEQKMPDFDLTQDNEFLSRKINTKVKNPLVGKFLFINREVRKKNVETILSVPEGTENTKYWDGRFLRLKGAARRAGFADKRIYKYKGKEIDRAVHLGIDLASTANASVKAANSGKVIFAQFVGIFGNTIIIDHGFGLSSLYSHLSQISVNTGDMVKKGDDIGFTGLTGLAGGDHLHFSMIVHNVFVNPVEWWDETWIKNNINSKIDYVKEFFN